MDYDGQKIQAVFNQSTENYLVDSDVVALASHCQVLEQQLVILPKGFCDSIKNKIKKAVMNG